MPNPLLEKSKQELTESTQEEQSESPEHETEEGGFNVDSNMIYSHITDQMDKTQKSNLDQLLKVTNDLIFGNKDTNHLVDSLTQSQSLGKDLGQGAFNFFLTLMKSSNQIPGDIVDSFGMIMIARVCEYLSEVGTPVTDEDYEEATHTFVTLVHGKFDPDFQKQMADRGIGQPEQEDQMQPDAAQPQQAQQQMTQQGV